MPFAQSGGQSQVEALAGEAEQRASQLQAVLTAISEIVLVYDAEGNLAFANDAAIRQLGIEATPEAMERANAGLQAWELYWSDGRPILNGERLRSRALAGEVIVGEELMYRPPAGGPLRWVRASAAPVRNPRGEITGAVVTAADITIQKEAQAERDRLLACVQAARENLRTIVDRLPDGVMVVDTAQRITTANNTIRRYVGHDVTGMALPELRRVHGFVMADGRPFPPGQAPSDRTLRGEAVTGVEARIQHLDGHTIDVLENTVPLHDAEGRLTGAVVALTDITVLRWAEAERERLLAEVEGARRNLQAVLHSLPNTVLVVDEALRVTMADDTAQQYLGPDIVGQSLAELNRRFALQDVEGRPIAEDDLPIQRALHGETITGLEMRARAPNGTEFYLLVGAMTLRDAQGRITGAVLVTTDISAQKQAQAELQAARENLRTLLERLPTGVLVTDTALRITLANDVAKQYMGPDLVGRTVGETIVGRVYEAPDGHIVAEDEMPLQRALRGETVTGMEMRVRIPGEWGVDTLSNAIALRDAQGRITGAVLVVTDITPQKQAQAERERLLAEVQTARENLRSIVNSLPDGVLVIDPSLHVTLSNEAVHTSIGRDVTGETASHLWRELRFTGPDGRPFPPGETPVERALRGEVMTGVEVGFQLPTGRRVDALDSAAALYNPDGSVREVAMVFTDVTPLKELDRAKDEFISVAAHELRTPLTALKGHAQILLRHAERAGWTESDRRNLRTIDDQVDRLNDLIGRLLNVSRIRMGRLQISRAPTDIVALAQQAAEELQVTTDRHRIIVQAEVVRLEGNWDPAALRQVLNNLIGNAIRYAVPGPIDVRIWREDGQAKVSVSDRGPGIPPERLSQIFEAFRPGAAEEYRRAGGLGLGLYISRGIVEAHGGHVGVESQVGVGTTFTFSLPLNGRP